MVVPKIKNEVEISAFDDGEDSDNYLIVLKERHWKVTKLIYYIYSSIDGSRNLVEIKRIFV